MEIRVVEQQVKKCIDELDEMTVDRLQNRGGMFYLLDPDGELSVHLQTGDPYNSACHENISHLPNARYEADQGLGFDEEAEEPILTPQDEFLKTLKACSDNIAHDLLMDWEYRLQQEGV